MTTRLIYASHATFSPAEAVSGVEPTVARILQESKRNNSKRDICGALYYRNGAFFQVLEGASERIDELMDKLQRDPRHTKVTVLQRKRVKERVFQSWSMKYSALDESVNHWLSGATVANFDPTMFSPEQADAFADVLLRGEEHNSNAALPTQGDESRPVWVVGGISLALTALLVAAFFYAF